MRGREPSMRIIQQRLRDLSGFYYQNLLHPLKCHPFFKKGKIPHEKV